ncbi:hypothetical protein KKF91_12395 [Myxococcota bacterium]|nr:hypothetical protein [Myxococcota bacterium]MBU1431332.1 hypothetical protein [Myxococcota bacterium]MBU1900268.1 hypothetical protein [Myxococcota bacterium]
MRGRLSLISPLLGLVVICACQPEPEPTPTPPDMRPLLAAYEAQEGHLDQAAALQIAEGLGGHLTTIFEVMRLFTELIAALSAGEEDTQQQSQGLATRRSALSFAADGWGRLTRRCPGVPGEAARGALKVTAIFDAQVGLGETLWGESEACRFEGDDGPRQFDGRIALRMLKDDAGIVNGYLFEFSGAITTNTTTQHQIDFQLLENNILLLRQEVERGKFLIGLDLSGDPFSTSTLPLFIRDSGGDWRCGLDQSMISGTCDGPNGESFSWP